MPPPLSRRARAQEKEANTGHPSPRALCSAQSPRPQWPRESAAMLRRRTKTMKRHKTNCVAPAATVDPPMQRTRVATPQPCQPEICPMRSAKAVEAARRRATEGRLSDPWMCRNSSRPSSLAAKNAPLLGRFLRKQLVAPNQRSNQQALSFSIWRRVWPCESPHRGSSHLEARRNESRKEAPHHVS